MRIDRKLFWNGKTTIQSPLIASTVQYLLLNYNTREDLNILKFTFAGGYKSERIALGILVSKKK